MVQPADSVVEFCDASGLGSNEGFEYMARTSPFGRVEHHDRSILPAECLTCKCWSLSDMVRTTVSVPCSVFSRSPSGPRGLGVKGELLVVLGLHPGDQVP